jgi:hypothetical protein
MSDLAKQFQADLDAGYGQQPPDESRMRPRKASVLGSGIAEANAQGPAPRIDEPRSSVELAMDSKGQTKPVVKIYASGPSLDDAQAAAALCAEIYDRLVSTHRSAS